MGRPAAPAWVARPRVGRLRRLVLPVVLATLTIGALAIGVFPTRDLLAKQDELRQAEAELAAARQANDDVERQVDALRTDAEVERRAREEFGLARPGEEVYVVLPPPADPVEIPDGWPFGRLHTRLDPGRAAVGGGPAAGEEPSPDPDGMPASDTDDRR